MIAIRSYKLFAVKLQSMTPKSHIFKKQKARKRYISKLFIGRDYLRSHPSLRCRVLQCSKAVRNALLRKIRTAIFDGSFAPERRYAVEFCNAAKQDEMLYRAKCATPSEGADKNLESIRAR